MDIIRELTVSQIDRKIEVYEYTINELNLIKGKLMKGEDLHPIEQSFLEGILLDFDY